MKAPQPPVTRHLEKQAKFHVRKLLEIEAQRWRARRAQVMRANATVASRFELSIIDDELEQIKRTRIWLDRTEVPRRPSARAS